MEIPPMRTAQWVKKLGGHSGELYVAAELSKRGIPNALLPENFSDDDLLAGAKDSSSVCFIQVKSCHPDRTNTFILRETDEKWCDAPDNQFVVFVWLGSPAQNEKPEYWVARKSEVGQECVKHAAHGTSNWERRFALKDLLPSWKNNWSVIEACLRDDYLHYTANGYHIARGVFSAAEVGEMAAHYMAMSAEGAHPGDSIGVPTRTALNKPDPLAKYPRLINMHRWDEKTKGWMNDMRLTEIVRELIGQEARLIQTMVYFKPSGSRGQSFHQDNLYLRTTPLMGAWVALDKADAENGAMDMVRGSHLFGLLPCQVADTDVSFTDSETVIPPGTEKDLIELEPGDVVFFGGYTIHGSRPNASSDRFRRAFICHYEGEHALPIVGPPLPKAEAK